ncbi:MAG TPA: isoprenylcysteine carboxylmethyltransferase family protein [Candidatus Binataceae bacterium]|nr:isoprenylcysteine carboxylmethyltransferase family protein [Candidatus Binataceae bacterium]
MTSDHGNAAGEISVRALIGTIVFTIFVPGTVVVFIPYLLSGWRIAPPFFGLSIVRWCGVAMILAAIPYFARFLSRFVVEGRGAPAPVMPTERLIVGGPFKHVRNPGYIGVVTMVAGQGLFFGSGKIIAYAIILAVIFHLFVLFYEEPALRRQFGTEYEEYCRNVPRWIARPQK